MYFEYNEIHEVEPGTFDAMPSLQLLFLNANLLRSLPTGVFSRVNLARLNLRNNHFLQLPVAGVLEHLTGLVQVGAIPAYPPPFGCLLNLRQIAGIPLIDSSRVRIIEFDHPH